MDGSEELCKYASAYTGIPVKNMIFQDLDEMNQYDGIWACSSILHLPKKELKMVFHKMVQRWTLMGLFIPPLNMERLKAKEAAVFLRISHRILFLILSRMWSRSE